MFGFMLFVHLTGLFAWLGGLLAIAVMLGMLKKQLGTPESDAMAARIVRVFSFFTHPGAVLVLISGIVMIVQMGMGDDKPLWLEVMEKGGGTIILLGLILTGIMGSKFKKRLRAGGAREAHKPLARYLTSVSAIMVLVLAVVLAVSLRI